MRGAPRRFLTYEFDSGAVQIVLRLALLCLCLGSVLVADAHAQTREERERCERAYSPRSGQAGKDVIWLPTPNVVVEAMLKAAQVTPNDVVYDLGAGDGKIPIAAARDFGARAVGIEYNPQLVRFAQCLAAAEGVAQKASIVEGDIFATDFSEATVVTMYLLPSLNERLIPTLLKMKPGTRIVSHAFLMGDWKPDEHIAIFGYDDAYLWRVPAQVKGTWTLTSAGRKPLLVKLDQHYQTVWGVVVEEEKELTIDHAALKGTELEFKYTGSNGLTAVRAVVAQEALMATISVGSRSVEFRGTRL